MCQRQRLSSHPWQANQTKHQKHLHNQPTNGPLVRLMHAPPFFTPSAYDARVRAAGASTTTVWRQHGLITDRCGTAGGRMRASRGDPDGVLQRRCCRGWSICCDNGWLHRGCCRSYSGRSAHGSFPIFINRVRRWWYSIKIDHAFRHCVHLFGPLQCNERQLVLACCSRLPQLFSLQYILFDKPRCMIR